jgi:hypothetical protein
VPWLRRLSEPGRVLWKAESRAWQLYRRLRPLEEHWEPGEREVLRAPLIGVTSYSVDRHILMNRRSTCLITDRRMIVRDERGIVVQMRAGQVRTARMYRTYDAVDGFSYGVALERVGSRVHVPEGDLLLLCATQQESARLAAAVEDMLAAARVQQSG